MIVGASVNVQRSVRPRLRTGMPQVRTASRLLPQVLAYSLDGCACLLNGRSKRLVSHSELLAPVADLVFIGDVNAICVRRRAPDELTELPARFDPAFGRLGQRLFFSTLPDSQSSFHSISRVFVRPASIIALCAGTGEMRHKYR